MQRVSLTALYLPHKSPLLFIIVASPVASSGGQIFIILIVNLVINSAEFENAKRAAEERLEETRKRNSLRRENLQLLSDFPTAIYTKIISQAEH